MLALLTVLLLFAAGCRQQLWVYQDEFKNLLLQVDWRQYDRDKALYPHSPDPEGMTVWFYPADGSKGYRHTTTEVNRYEAYLAQGDYVALLMDYSPEEYGRQEFLGMDYASTAKVQSKPDPYQPARLGPLYDSEAYFSELMSKEPTGNWTVSCQPEPIATDVRDMNVPFGRYANYVPYEERDSYQASLMQYSYSFTPMLIPRKMRVRIPVKGIYYMYQLEGSVAGLADGWILVENHSSDDPCLMALNDWEVYATGENEGYIAITFNTWGLRNRLWSSYDLFGDKPFLVDAGEANLRFNLRFLLRDRQSVCCFHIDAGNQVYVFPNEYALSVDLRGVLSGDKIPTLPYVEAANGVDLGGVVVPWEDGADVNVNF